MMGIREYLDNKNVMTLDVWVALVMFILIPEPGSDPAINSSTIVPMLTMAILIFSAFVILMLFCSKLRGYRYLDIYIDCQKPATKLVAPIGFSGLIFIMFLVIIGASIFYPLFATLVIFGLSVHFNNSKDLNQ